MHLRFLDILIKFRTHSVVLTTDVSKMYREIQLIPSDKDYHLFVWREEPNKPICDFKMTHVTFIDLFSKAYMCTLQRIISRRGLITTIHSSHGTNVVGADNRM